MVTGAPTKPDIYGMIARAYEKVGLEPSASSVLNKGDIYLIHVESGKSGNREFYHDMYTIPLQGGIMRQALIPLVAQEPGKEELEDKLLTARENVARACGVDAIVAPPDNREGVVAKMFSRNGFSWGIYKGNAVFTKSLNPHATN